MRADCKKNAKERIGEISFNHYNEKMEIIEYYSTSNIIVKFEYGYTCKTSYYNFKRGNVKTPYTRTCVGIGYLGEGKYSYTKNKEAFGCWYSLLNRCFNKGCSEYYEDCLVWKEWLNFQVFAEWYENKKYDFYGKTLELDKDLKQKGNKLYSPNTCLLLPHELNCLIINCKKSRGDLPVGVTHSHGKYGTQIQKYGKRVPLGRYDTINEAFSIYKQEKEKYIKEIADKYQEILPQEVYEALYSWEIDITD